MNKWGVRLVGWYFLIWAISDVLGLMIDSGQTRGFLGISADLSYDYNLPFYKGTGQIEIMRWAGVCVLVYVGYNLLRFKQSGRMAALIVLWPTAIISGFYFILMILSSVSVFYYSGTRLSATLNFFHTNWPGEISDPIILPLAFGSLFLLNFIITYFLMRKDTKQLFKKPATSEVNKLESEEPAP